MLDCMKIVSQSAVHLLPFGEPHTLKLWRADDALSLMNGLLTAHYTQTLGQQWSSVGLTTKTKICVSQPACLDVVI